MSLYDQPKFNNQEILVSHNPIDGGYINDQTPRFLMSNPTSDDGKTYLHKARIQGRDDALRMMFKNLYMRYYRTKPLRIMNELENEIFELNEKLKRYDIFITINPYPDLNERDTEKFKDACNRIGKRSWIAKTINSNFEFRDKDKQSGLHFHGMYRLSKIIYPSEISSMLFRGVFKHYVMTKNHIHVEKVRSYHKCIDYINKDKIVKNDVSKDK